MSRELKSKGRPALEILEQAMNLLRNAAAGTIFSYLVGSVPFLLAVLFFFSEMTRNPFADERLAWESLAVAALFVWKRIWQAVFAAQLHEQLSGRGFEMRNLPRLIAVQCALQPLRMIALPVSLLMTLPFGWVVAFFAMWACSQLWAILIPFKQHEGRPDCGTGRIGEFSVS